MSDYRVKVTVRNNRLLEAIEEAGFVTQREFCEAAEITENQLSALVAFRSSPLGSSGSFTEPARAIMEILGAAPSDLWSEEQLTLRLKRNSAERIVDADGLREALEARNEMLVIPSGFDLEAEREVSRDIRDAMAKLAPREQKILALRYGLDGSEETSLREIGELCDVTLERVRQIEAKALRKLRAPKCSDALLVHVFGMTRDELDKDAQFANAKREAAELDAQADKGGAA